MPSQPTVFVHGYAPERRKRIEKLAAQASQDVDIRRLGPGISINQVRDMAKWCSVAPTDHRSVRRTTVLNLDGIRTDAQSALLRILEEPPRTAFFILSKATTHGILPTILSRCIVREFRFAGYSKSLKDLETGGMELSQAARVANFMELGYTTDEVPSEQDFTNAQALLDNGISKDAEMGVSIAASFTAQTLVALRQLLVSIQEFGALAKTYGQASPQDAAIMTLVELQNVS